MIWKKGLEKIFLFQSYPAETLSFQPTSTEFSIFSAIVSEVLLTIFYTHLLIGG